MKRRATGRAFVIRRFLLLACWCWLAAAPALARRNDETKRIGDDLTVRVWSPWPQSVSKGWAPIFVDLRNSGEDELRVELKATGWDWYAERQIQAIVDVPAGGDVKLELLAPMNGVNGNEFGLSVKLGADRDWFGSAVGQSFVGPRRAVLLVSPAAPEAGALERMSDALDASSAPTGSPGPSSDVEVVWTDNEGLAQHPAAYSSLDLVVLDARAGLPNERELAGVTSWMRSGGDVLVIGAEAQSAARSIEAFGEWMSPRFALEGADDGHEFIRAYRAGLGQLRIGSRDGELDGDYAERVAEFVHFFSPNAPSAAGWRSSTLAVELDDLARLPHRAIAGILILFALVIGPFNFWFVRKRGRPVLLLFTIPILSLAATGMLLGYGVLMQGLDVKTASSSTTLLDQRAHRSTCVEKRELFAGLAPAAGLTPGPGTVVFDASVGTSSYALRKRRFDVTHGAELLLSGDFLPSRRLVSQVLTVDRAERARLEVETDEGRPSIVNHLGVRVDEVLVRDEAGRVFANAGALEPGARSTLTELDAESAERRVAELVQGTPQLFGHSVAELPIGAYLATLAASPFRDDCGVECNERSGKHVVLGILPIAEEAQR